MHFDLATRIVTLGVGELAGFSLGPRESKGGAAGLWRAHHDHSAVEGLDEEAKDIAEGGHA